MFISHHLIALTFGYKLFEANTVDGLTIEQYNMLVELFNKKAGAQVQQLDKHKYSTQLTTVEGKDGIDYGDD